MNPPVRIDLTTARLRLREWTLGDSDVDALLAIDGDPRVTRYMTFDPCSREQTLSNLRDRLAERLSSSRATFEAAITLGTDGQVIGRCGLGHLRAEHREAELWYALNFTAWGKGYAQEAARAMLRFGFDRLGLHRIWADCDPRNAGSCRLAEKLGMKCEGHLRENYWLKGEWCDTALYAILDREFAANDGKTSP